MRSVAISVKLSMARKEVMPPAIAGLLPCASSGAADRRGVRRRPRPQQPPRQNRARERAGTTCVAMCRSTPSKHHPPRDLGHAGSVRECFGQDLNPLFLAPAPAPLRTSEHRDLTHRPLLGAQIRAHSRPVTHRPDQAGPAGGYKPTRADGIATRYTRPWGEPLSPTSERTMTTWRVGHAKLMEGQFKREVPPKLRQLRGSDNDDCQQTILLNRCTPRWAACGGSRALYDA